ncbi:MAG: hypothetical protein ACOC0X_01785 [Halobacteriota archaeon]
MRGWAARGSDHASDAGGRNTRGASRVVTDGGREPAGEDPPQNAPTDRRDPATETDDADTTDSTDDSVPPGQDHPSDGEPTTGRRGTDRGSAGDHPAKPARGIRTLLALPAGILEGAITVVATWLFVGMAFLFEIGGDVEAFEGRVTGSVDSDLSTAIDAFASEEVLVGAAKLISWLFAGSHQVAVDVSRGDTSGSVNMVTALADTGELATPIVYFLIPPVLLLYGGYQLARAKPRAMTRQSFAVGAMIAIGYAAGAGVIGFLSSSDAGGLSASPNPLVVVLFAGIYGVIFGGLGGLIADALHRS